MPNGRTRNEFYQDVGTARIKSAPIPGTCEMFLFGMCDHLSIPRYFWKHRRRNEWWFPPEVLVLELITLRLRERYFRHRWDFEDMFLMHGCVVMKLLKRHRLMKDEYPDLFRACLKMEGEQSGRFCLELAKEIGYVDACHQGVAVPSVR